MDCCPVVAEPSRVTAPPRVAVWSSPALATVLAATATVTVLVIGRLVPPGPDTVRVMVAGPFADGVQMACPRVDGVTVPFDVDQAYAVMSPVDAVPSSGTGWPTCAFAGAEKKATGMAAVKPAPLAVIADE